MSNENTSSGVGLGTILFVVFLVLKLIHVIGWSWWWITAPLWIPAVVAISIFVVGMLIAGFLRGF